VLNEPKQNEKINKPPLQQATSISWVRSELSLMKIRGARRSLNTKPWGKERLIKHILVKIFKTYIEYR